MKNKIFIFILAIILFTSCNNKNNTVTENNITNNSSKTATKYIHREGNQLLQNDTIVSLNAVNFDNLTWFSKIKMDDDTPVFKLHHNEDDYDTVKTLGFNSIRYFIRWQDLYSDPVKLKKYDAGWEWLDQNIEWARERNISLIIDFHCPYGGFGAEEEIWPIWEDDKIRSAYISAWKEIAQKYKDEIVIAGYDLMNEPSLPANGENEYRSLMEDTISAIREEDPYHLLIVEAAVGINDNIDSWLRPTWVQVSDQNIMYSFHFYEPLIFTHNGLNLPIEEVNYPNFEYSQSDLKKAFYEYIDEPFLKNYPLFLSEFGCNDWTENSGSAQWISDVYKLCEDNNINTSFFAYRSFINGNKSDFSFAISNIYYNINAESDAEEYINNDIINSLK